LSTNTTQPEKPSRSDAARAAARDLVRRLRALIYVLRRAQRMARSSARGAEMVWSEFLDWFHARKFNENTILVWFAALIGVVGGLSVVVFYRLIDLSYWVFFQFPSRFLGGAVTHVHRPVLTALGLGAAWWIMRRLGRGHDGMNVADVQATVAKRGGNIPPRPALARTAASAVTLGAGGSAGSEGPVAVLGSAVGAFLARAFRMSHSRVRVLVGAGAAAAISAAFNAPLAGAFFALEEILGSFAVAAFPPVVVAAVIGSVVARLFLGTQGAFDLAGDYEAPLATEVLLLCPLLGLATALVSVAFIRGHFRIGDKFATMNLPPLAKAAIGGSLVGVAVFASGGALVGQGHLAIPLVLLEGLPWFTLALLVFGKMVTTSITLGAGGSGGLFTPSLYIGAATGAAFAALVQAILPGFDIANSTYMLVAMGAVVAVTQGAPITGLLIVYELTNSHEIVLPLMMTIAISWVIARRFEHDNLNSGWLRRRGVSISHVHDTPAPAPAVATSRQG